MNEVAVKETVKEAVTVGGYLNSEKVKGYLESVLKERAGQFVASLVSLSNLTPGLAKCEPKSLMMCGLKAAALNLPLDNNLGFAYAIPYGNEASFQLGYKAYVQLAMRTGLYRSINVIDVRDGEIANWDALTETISLKIIDDEKIRDKTPVIGYAATFELNNGFKKVIFKKMAAILAHGKRFSKTFNKGPWQTDTDAMCRKTILKDMLSKWGPLSTEVAEAIKADQAVIRQTEHGEEELVYLDVQDVPQIEPATYDCPPEMLSALNGGFDILGTTQADRVMKLAACKGDAKKFEALLKELSAEVDKKNAGK